RRVHHVDDVAPPGEVEEPLGAGGADVDAAVRDVALALGALRPGGGVDVRAAVRQPGGPGDSAVVAVGRVAGNPDGRRVHRDGAGLLQRQVDAVGGRIAVASGAGRDHPHDPAVLRHRHLVAGDVDGGDVGVPDPEPDRALVGSPGAPDLEAPQVAADVDLGTGL